MEWLRRLVEYEMESKDEMEQGLAYMSKWKVTYTNFLIMSSFKYIIIKSDYD